jgi:hypothetical protein
MGAEEWVRYTDEIRETLRKWGVFYPPADPITSHVSSLNGTERRRFWRQAVYLPEERRITVAFQWREPGSLAPRKDISFTLSTKPTPWENAEIMAKALEALRLAEVRGSARAMMRIYRQMYPMEQQRQAPPPPRDEPRQTNAPSWAKTLCVDPDAPSEVIEAAYRALSKKAHPDYGGSHERMKALNLAMEQARLARQRAS